MGYQTGTSTGPDDLLDKLRAFLLVEGWTVNDFSVDGTGKRLHVMKSFESGAVGYFNLRSAIAEEIFKDAGGSSTITGIGLNGSTGYDAGEDWDEQPGFSQNRNRSNQAGGVCIVEVSISSIPAYYFFTVGDSVHVAVEVASGELQFMSFGRLVKQGAYTGGFYFTASYPSYNSDYFIATYGPAYFSAPYVQVGSFICGYVYIDADSTANWRMAESYAPGTDYEIAFSGINGAIDTNQDHLPLASIASFFQDKSPNFYNNIAAMCPLYTFLYRSDGNYSIIGWPAGVRFLNTTNYSMGQEVTYGSETWKIFRTGNINGVTPEKNIYAGFAFLKET